MDLNRSGIYGIRNNVNEKRYIGSSVNIAKRFYRHRKDLRQGKHHSRYLQRAWDKYGEGSFTFYVEEFCEPDLCLILEDLYLSFGFPEYNINPFASTSKGRRLSEVTKQRISASIRKLGIKPPSSTWLKKRKKVEALAPDSDQVIQVFESLTAACKWLGRDHTFVTMITRCCNGKAKKGLALGYKWRWAE